MKLLLAVDSIGTFEILLNDNTGRSWPAGTEACVLSIVEDGEVPLETWREHGYGIAAVRQEKRRTDYCPRAKSSSSSRHSG